MNMLLILVLILVIAAAAYATVRKFRKGGGCCGEHEDVALCRAADTNKAHYPFSLVMEIGGMTCDNCARRTANALNSLDGVRASVSFDEKKALVRTKTEPDERALQEAVLKAGYVVMGIERKA